MVYRKKRLSMREKFKGDLYWKQCWYLVELQVFLNWLTVLGNLTEHNWIRTNKGGAQKFLGLRGVKYLNTGLVQASLCWMKYHAFQSFWESGNMAPHVLSLDTRLRWSASFTPRSIVLGLTTSIIRWRGSLVGPRDNMDTSEKIRIVAFLLELRYLRLEDHSIVTTLTELLSFKMKSGQFLENIRK